MWSRSRPACWTRDGASGYRRRRTSCSTWSSRAAASCASSLEKARPICASRAGVVNINYGDSLGLFQRLRDVLVADLSAFPQIRSAFEALLAEHSNAREGSEALTQALMSQCLVYLLRHLAEQPDDSLPWLTSLDDPGLGQALDLIFDRPGDHHTVASLADAALMGRSSFAERFHDAFGVPPMKFLHDVRLRRAAEMFQRDPTLAVDQVAGRMGFTSRSHFSQEFKRRFGASPAAFRGGWLTPRTLG